jgi:hypothetical protein
MAMQRLYGRPRDEFDRHCCCSLNDLSLRHADNHTTSSLAMVNDGPMISIGPGSLSIRIGIKEIDRS